MFNFAAKRDLKAKEEEKKKSLQELKDAHDAAVEQAKQCLHDPKFKKFISMYEDAEKRTIDVLIKYSKDETDPLKFAFGAKDLLSKLSNIKAMLDGVHINAGEKYGGQAKD